MIKRILKRLRSLYNPSKVRERKDLNEVVHIWQR